MKSDKSMTYVVILTLVLAACCTATCGPTEAHRHRIINDGDVRMSSIGTRASELGSGGRKVTISDRRADSLFDTYFEEYLQLYSTIASRIGNRRYDDRLEVTISVQHRRLQTALAEKYLRLLGDLDVRALSADRRMSHDLLHHQLKDLLAGLAFPSHLMPIHTMDCFPDEFATMGSGQGDHQFTTQEDYEHFLTRIDDFLIWVDTAIDNMKEGTRRGYVLPKIVANATIDLLARQLVKNPDDSSFFLPLSNLPDTLDASARTDLLQRYRSAIELKVLPTYRKLVEFMREEYAPACRNTVAWSELPDGDAWYRYLVRSWTTTDLSPADIHALGQREVARIAAEYTRVNALISEINGLETYHNEQKLVAAYEQLSKTIAPGLDRLFGFAPRMRLEIRATHLGAHYRPGTGDGSRPGRFMIGIGDIATAPQSVSEALFLHEAIPGHHYQISLQQEAQLPRFRKHVYMYAYMEGWGLYAESLGHDLGLFTNPASNADRLHSELFRAIRLVVDTGIHSKGWSAEQAMNYFRKHIGYAPEREVIRYIAWPGQALSYKVGEQKIIGLREHARKILGSDFDIRKFHRRVLDTGPVPLSLLGRSIDSWIAATARSGSVPIQ